MTAFSSEGARFVCADDRRVWPHGQKMEGRLDFGGARKGAKEGRFDLSWLGWKIEQDAWLSENFPFLFFS